MWEDLANSRGLVKQRCSYTSKARKEGETKKPQALLLWKPIPAPASQTAAAHCKVPNDLPKDTSQVFGTRHFLLPRKDSEQVREPGKLEGSRCA